MNKHLNTHLINFLLIFGGLLLSGAMAAVIFAGFSTADETGFSPVIPASCAAVILITLFSGIPLNRLRERFENKGVYGFVFKTCGMSVIICLGAEIAAIIAVNAFGGGMTWGLTVIIIFAVTAAASLLRLLTLTAMKKYIRNKGEIHERKDRAADK